ncbi:uncharacterized protein LAESUDRAFT_719587 [Laetiporus sulphureus 93-53]|uniref:Methyltransferase domain-containing protein n=1 Tax=Laetiporus sulphureus 93-53 TaxID=1314785 RepID=A0A165ILQ5_9APHY|nr:uncharacterized protein LAESUDRAFT_719587 [Laetiporus sulphureus 93-53]KZT13253.1 hypothetical protein LAESUDRAFT_719587 [Laetiporus sulphureus 93-53]
MANITPEDLDFFRKQSLDERYYDLEADELAFFKSQTGIQDEEELKQHIMKVQEDAFEIYPYPCIRRFAFTKLKISRLPAYDQLLKLGKERKGAIFLDIGCCFGNDVRKAVADGYPAQNAIASDLQPEFWELGRRLFRDTPEAFPVPFVPGDAFNTSFLKPVPPFCSPPETPVPPLSSLTTLTPLLGHVSAIHASSFFHLFDEAQQLQLARSVAGLLSPAPGSMIFGEHVSRPEKGYRTEQLRPNAQGPYMFCHSPDSWKEIWDGQVFEKGTVEVKAVLKERNRYNDLNNEPGEKSWKMAWSVTRL